MITLSSFRCRNHGCNKLFLAARLGHHTTGKFHPRVCPYCGFPNRYGRMSMSQEEIISMLKRKGPLKARELSHELRISYPTICKSIKKLELSSEIICNVSDDGMERTYYITE